MFSFLHNNYIQYEIAGQLLNDIYVKTNIVGN